MYSVLIIKQFVMLSFFISKESASGILSYYLGRTEFIDGSWQKVTIGILEERRQSVKAA